MDSSREGGKSPLYPSPGNEKKSASIPSTYKPGLFNQYKVLYPPLKDNEFAFS